MQYTYGWVNKAQCEDAEKKFYSSLAMKTKEGPQQIAVTRNISLSTQMD